MKNISKGFLLLLIILLLVVLIVILFRCCNKPGPQTSTTEYSHIPLDITQLVVLRKPGTDQATFNKWLDSVRILCGNLNVKSVCTGCDSSLLLLVGSGIENYIQGQTAKSTGGTGKDKPPAGEDGPVFYSLNFPVNFIDLPARDTPYKGEKPRLSPTKTPEIPVGIFDTGVDPAESLLQGSFYTSTVLSCLGPTANDGWNFAYGNSNWNDDYASKHGTVVSGFIAEQAFEYGQNPVKILPVKLHDSIGRSDLYSVLCGLSYARQRGAKIINASFGYYAPKFHVDSAGNKVPDSSGYLLKVFIEEQLLPDNILLVAAAGNRDDSNESSVYPTTDTVASRNLDSVCFYPASLSQELRNVIAVTTINIQNNVSPHQNFSGNVVDIGVYADRPDDFAFQNPISLQKSVIGSSFATPIVAGKLASNYFLIEGLLAPGNNFTKDELWSKLGTGIVKSENQLTSKLIKGRVMVK